MGTFGSWCLDTQPHLSCVLCDLSPSTEGSTVTPVRGDFCEVCSMSATSHSLSVGLCALLPDHLRHTHLPFQLTEENLPISLFQPRKDCFYINFTEKQRERPNIQTKNSRIETRKVRKKSCLCSNLRIKKLQTFGMRDVISLLHTRGRHC